MARKTKIPQQKEIKKISGNIKKYYFYQLFNNFVFFSPVIVIFWQSRGLNMTQIMALQSIYALGVVILELPTGAFADYFGKRLSLILGSFVSALGFFVYGISFKFWQFAFGELIVGAGMAFISGADRAFIHETLKSIEREKDYQKIEGRARGLNKIAMALGNFFGGLIGSVSLSLTLIVSAISTFIASLVGISFTETKVKLARKEKTEYLEIIKEGLDIVKNNKEVLWLVLFFAAFNSLVWTTNWFSQPYLKMLKVPVVYFGGIFAAFSLVSAIASSLVDKFEKLTKGKPFLVMGLATAISMFLLGKFPSIFVFPLWSLFGSFVLINHTLVSDKVLAAIPSGRAATILSLQNLIRRCIYAVFGPFLGKISDLFGLRVALQANAGFLLVILGSLLLTRKNFKSSLEKT